VTLKLRLPQAGLITQTAKPQHCVCYNMKSALRSRTISSTGNRDLFDSTNRSLLVSLFPTRCDSGRRRGLNRGTQYVRLQSGAPGAFELPLLRAGGPSACLAGGADAAGPGLGDADSGAVCRNALRAGADRHSRTDVPVRLVCRTFYWAAVGTSLRVTTSVALGPGDSR
jgi:hypothetical protein